MSNYPPDEPVYPATPTYDEVVVTTTTVPEGDSGSKASQVKDQAEQTAGQAKETVRSAAGDVKDEAANVAATAQDAGRQVAGTTRDQAQRVVAGTLSQARDLYGQATTELSSQAAKQQDRLTRGLRTFGEDLSKMGEHADAGPASDLVQNLSDRAHRVAEWLESRHPEDVLYEVRQYAARRPGLFIGLAAVTGVVAARLTKALVADAKSGAAASGSPASGSTYTGYTGNGGGTYVGGGSYVGGGVGDTPVIPEPLGTEYGTGAGYGTDPGSETGSETGARYGAGTAGSADYASEYTDDELGRGTQLGGTR